MGLKRKLVSSFCEFEKLGMREMTVEDEFIQLKLIEGMCDALYEHKNLEQLQLSDISLSAYVDFMQQLELINKSKSNAKAKSILSYLKQYKYCNKVHGQNK